MLRNRFHITGFVALAAAAFATMPARAASLQQVTSWGASGVPTYVAMYIYVPNTLATKPPILVVSHYCGGDAAGVFGEAQSGGIVAAADKYGFIMIFPQNHQPGSTRNCWDVGSSASLTHDGGGDTQAIAQMVKYTITKYTANADRVYATGTSSGAMMTEALLAVYPDVFKAGAEFSGVPAGCWADGYASSNQWSGNCAGGKTTFTAAQWGDKVRAMDSGYSGHRPRVQLWHGMSDPTINYNNQTEAIKEWTNVLSLSTTPTTTTSVTISGHQWTRQSWTNTCGYTVLDAWGETGGPHGTDSNLNATYVIPFLALDQAGDTDPEITKCGGGGGTSSTGGATSSAGGTTSAGGKGGTGGTNATTGGNYPMGGTMATAGRSSTGGVAATGGAAIGGSNSGGAATTTGGAPGAGGKAQTGGRANTGGVSAVAGEPGTGGAVGPGGALGAGGSSASPALSTGGLANATGGSSSAPSSVAAGGNGNPPSSTGTETSGQGTTNAGGCSCTVGSKNSPSKLLGLALSALLVCRRRRRH